MEGRRDLELLLRSGVPVVAIESQDEVRLVEMLREIAFARAADYYEPFFRWSVTDGLQRIDIDLAPQLHNADPADVLKHIRALDKPGTFLLLDFHPYLSDPVNVRLIKDICLRKDEVGKKLVLISHELVIPDELEAYVARLELALPDRDERKRIVKSVASEWKSANAGTRVKTDPRAYELLVDNLAGLTSFDTRKLARNAIFQDGAISHSDLPEVMRAKHELLNAGGVLHFEYDTARFRDVGGLAGLKAWLEQRRAAFAGEGRPAYLDPPRGMLLLGVQGCGKSLAAKATASVFGVPLLRLDFATLYNKYHGETERNLRDALKSAEVMAPCVLWIDEIEKGVALQDSDSGTSMRVLATFLTWMAENKAPVFVVATSNDISRLPAELVRKGRFDEIFFVDLPSAAIRAEIAKIHLAARNQEISDTDLEKFVEATAGFSGAELEQAIVSALYSTHARGTGLKGNDLVSEAARTRPLSVVMAERVEAMRMWAKDRTVPAD